MDSNDQEIDHGSATCQLYDLVIFPSCVLASSLKEPPPVIVVKGPVSPWVHAGFGFLL